MNGTTITKLAAALAAALLPPFAEAAYDVRPEAGEQGLRAALEEAGLDGGASEVVVHAGEYVITETLSIWPGTTLTLEDGALIRASRGCVGGCMLYGRHWEAEDVAVGTVRRTCLSDSCPHGGYTQCHDVVVQGGTWDCNAGTDEDKCVFLFQHASSVTIRNLAAKNCSNHFFNLSGSKDVLVENVAFSSSVEYRGTDPDFWRGSTVGDKARYTNIEAIHLDFVNDTGERGSVPSDGTPSRDVVVRNCSFDSVFAGVGNHHYPSADPASNVLVEGCSFRNLRGYAVYCYGFEGMEVSDNSVTGGQGLMDCKRSSCVASGNVVNDPKLYGAFVADGAVAVLDDNRFFRSSGIAVCAKQNASVDLRGNDFETTGGHAVVLIGCKAGVVSGNTFRGIAKTAILASDKTPMDAVGNTIVSPGTQGITAQTGAKLAARSNAISGAKGIGILVDSAAAGSSVVGNTVSASGSHGIRIFKTKGCTVDSNVVTGGKDGIVFDQCGSGTATRNTVTKTATHAIRLVGTKAIPTTVTVQNNVLSTGKPKKSFDVRLGDYCRKCKIIGNDLVHKRYSVSKKGTKKNTYKPVPTTISSARRSSSKKALSVVWKKYARATGYELQYAANSSFKKAKTRVFASPKKLKATVKNLSDKKKYWIRVRTFQDLSRVRHYSNWSPVVISDPTAAPAQQP